METMIKLLAGGAGLAALAVAAPAASQSRYGQPYGYGNATRVAAQRCSSAVQGRLSNRTGMAGILRELFGVRRISMGRVLQVTSIDPNRTRVRVRGLASSGRRIDYGQYGYGTYGSARQGYQPDLSFRCDVDYRGYVRNVDINRR